MSRRVSFFIGMAIVAVIGFAYVTFGVIRGTRPATPTEIAKAIAPLDKSQRTALASILQERKISPLGAVEPLSYHDLYEAVGRAKGPSREARIIDSQDDAIERATGNITQKGNS